MLKLRAPGAAVGNLTAGPAGASMRPARMGDCRANELETLGIAMHSLVDGKVPARILGTKEASRLELPVADRPQLGFPHFMRTTKELDGRGASRANAVFAMRAEFVRPFEVFVLAPSPLLR